MLFFKDGWADHWVLIGGVAFTTLCWMAVMFLTPETDEATLRNFYAKIRPFGSAWQRRFGELAESSNDTSLGRNVLSMVIAVMLVYAVLFATGKLLYGELDYAGALYAYAAVLTMILIRLQRKINKR
jgi:SSS family solute:Na+ symporter